MVMRPKSEAEAINKSIGKCIYCGEYVFEGNSKAINYSFVAHKTCFPQEPMEWEEEYLLEDLIHSLDGSTFEWKKNAIKQFISSQIKQAEERAEERVVK